MRHIQLAALVLTAAFPEQILAQATAPAPAAKRVRDIADLPRFAYPVSGDVGRLLDRPSELAPLVARLKSDVTRTLADYDIEDRATLGQLHRILRDIAIFENDLPGFERYNERLDDPGGFVLPHPPRDRRAFDTPTGRARFSVNELDVVSAPPGRLVLQTLRSHDQYNTTIYGLDDRYRGISGGRRVVFVHPDDLAALGVADAATVDVVSHFGDGVRRVARGFRAVAYPVSLGSCAAYFPETNVLVPLDSTAEGSQTPTSKSVVVSLEPVAT